MEIKLTIFVLTIDLGMQSSNTKQCLVLTVTVTICYCMQKKILQLKLDKEIAKVFKVEVTSRFDTLEVENGD